MTDKPLVERAFELARSGRFTTTTDIRKHLMAEGYTYADIAANLAGGAIQKDLRDAIAASWKPTRRR